MQIVLASTSPVKVSAVMLAMKRLEIEAELIAMKAESGVHEQPFEFETLEGAKNRVDYAVAHKPDADYYLAIESGLFETDGNWHDVAVVVLRDAQGKYGITRSKGVLFPTKAVKECQRRGDPWTVGKVLVEMELASQHDDPHKDLVGVSRSDYINEAAYNALLGIAGN